MKKLLFLLFALFCVLFFSNCQLENKKSYLLNEKEEEILSSEFILIFDDTLGEFGQYRELIKESIYLEPQGKFYVVFKKNDQLMAGFIEMDSIHANTINKFSLIDLVFSDNYLDTIRSVAFQGVQSGPWYAKTNKNQLIFIGDSAVNFAPKNIYLRRTDYRMDVYGENGKHAELVYKFDDFLCKYLALPNNPENRRNGLNGLEKRVLRCPDMDTVWVEFKKPTCSWTSSCLPEPIVPKTNSDDKEENLLPPELRAPKKDIWPYKDDRPYGYPSRTQ